MNLADIQRQLNQSTNVSETLMTVDTNTQDKPMNPRLTYNDMKALKVGDLLRFQRSHGVSDTNPIDTVAVVTVPFGQVFDKQGNVVCAVKVYCARTFGSFKLEGVTSHNFHLFRKLS